MHASSTLSSTLPIVSLSTSSPKLETLSALSEALFNTGFCYVVDHGISEETIKALTSRLPALFSLPETTKKRLAKINSPHFVGYDGVGSETTLGEPDLREQFDFGFTGAGGVLGAIAEKRKEDQLFWNLLGPNLVPTEEELPGFERALNGYADALEGMSERFVGLIEEALGIPGGQLSKLMLGRGTAQNRVKIVRYPGSGDGEGLGVGPHKDSSGWLTFLLQTGEAGKADGLEVASDDGTWLPVPNLLGSFVVNFGNAFEAATEGAVKATIHRVTKIYQERFSVPFFLGLPLDLTVDELRAIVPDSVRQRGRVQLEEKGDTKVDEFLDERWKVLGESMLRKWIRSHRDVAERWYPEEKVRWYLAT